MIRADRPISRKRMVSSLILGVGGLASLLVGLSWGEVLHARATYLARTENAFNLIYPEYVFIAHTVVSGIVGLGHFLLVFGVAAMLAGLSGATCTYLRENPRWAAPGFRRAFALGTGALILLAAGATAWATSAVSYEDKLAAEPPARAASRNVAGGKEHHADCVTPPTPRQQETAGKLAADTKAGVAKYADPSAARADGYQPGSPAWQPTTHYLNPAYQRDGRILDPGRPESLVYANTSEGAVLLGAMYLMPEPGDPGPRVGGCLTQWHAHSSLGWETPEMMHVWTADVPGGPFSEIRPREFVQSLEGFS